MTNTNPPDEIPLDPDRPIIDPHIHLWDAELKLGAASPGAGFSFGDFEAVVKRSGHNVTHAVLVECHAMYRKNGPVELRSLGETEYAVATAERSAIAGGTGLIANRFVAHADLCLGASVQPVLEAHRAIAGPILRGIRTPVAFSEAGMFGRPCKPSRRHQLLDPAFRAGAEILSQMDLSLDVWCLHHQLGDLGDLAAALPDLTIILDHIGTPDLGAATPDAREEIRNIWTEAIHELARRPNVFVKVGGMGLRIWRGIGNRGGDTPSTTLAEKWRPMVETCIEAFTPERTMFESNFPPDRDAATYGAIWNCFKIITRGASDVEKTRLFHDTAGEVYRIA